MVVLHGQEDIESCDASDMASQVRGYFQLHTQKDINLVQNMKSRKFWQVSATDNKPKIQTSLNALKFFLKKVIVNMFVNEISLKKNYFFNCKL